VDRDDPTPDDLLPLPPATLHILLAVAETDRHGYAIRQDVEARTDGALRLSAGTLYRAIARMVEQGLIEEVDRPLQSARGRRARPEDERRRYYRITSFGASVARAEVRRLMQLVRHAQARGMSPRTA
jgi:DNA-binding PadR family transcriptional regulator